MLTGIHFLLTYSCNFECDHCFLYCSPRSEGTFTISQIKKVLDEAKRLETVKEIYFEGGEPFLFYPIMIEGIKLACKAGFNVGIVTNSYWATNVQDSIIWLKPLKDLGLFDFSVSNDDFHFDSTEKNNAKIAMEAAKKLRLPIYSICIDQPQIIMNEITDSGDKNFSQESSLRYRGRAVDTLINKSMCKKEWQELNECKYEDLESLGRVHVDPFGNVFICQGLSIGNYLQVSFSKIIKDYEPRSHPIIEPLLEGGPTKLIEEYNINHEEKYVDECHLCYLARKNLIEKFPEFLGPKQVYGL
ncbi:MAG: radical SAM protein [Promethearchaeota archaeon]